MKIAVYASFKYDWGPQENGYYLTLVGASRVLVLIVIIPFAIKLFRKPTPVPSSPQPEEPLVELEEGSDERNAYEKSLKEWEEEAKYLRVVHDSRSSPPPPSLLPPSADALSRL